MKSGKVKHLPYKKKGMAKKAKMEKAVKKAFK